MGRAFAARSRLCVRRWARTDKIAGQLADFSGILQGDGYAAYKVLARGHGGAIQLAFCLAHARRKFVEVCNTTSSPFAREVIERLQAIYAIEAEIRGSSAQQRLAARGARTAPLMEALKARLTEMVGQLFSQSKLTEAINYALNHWEGLTLFLSDGRVEVDSNKLSSVPCAPLQWADATHCSAAAKAAPRAGRFLLRS
jgi:transposase